MHQPSSLPFTILPASGEAAPVVLSSPHSGRVYPKAVLERLRVNGRTLLPLDDGPIDKLVQLACEAGATLVAARYPRVVVDLNREPDELDPEIVRDAHAMPDMRVTARARAGLGVVPSRIGGQPLWRRPFGADELRRQIDDLYHPYHAQLETLMVERRERLGIAILLDCHSMPNAAALGDPIVDAALGDRFGRSCAGELVSAVEALLRNAGLKVARNRPYAGGTITGRHGQPEHGRHALQLELRRGLFMDESTHVPHAGFAALRQLLGELPRALAIAAKPLIARSARHLAQAS
jgi:N-formylglutamate amidohydrolase